MELFTQLFGDLLAFVYHCFDRIVIYGYLSHLSRPEQVVHFFRDVVGVAPVSKEVLSERTGDYQAWVEAFARNHRLPIEWAEKGVRKEDHVLPWQRRMARQDAYGVYFIFKSMEQGASFRVTVPKYPAKDPNYRILAPQRSRFTHYYFYIRDEVLGPMVMRVGSFFPFQTSYYLNGHSFIEQELKRAQIGLRKTDNAFLAVDDVAALQAAGEQAECRHHPPAARLLDPDPGTEVLRQGTQAVPPVTLLCDRPDRVLPQLHLQASLPNPQAVRTQLRARPVAADPHGSSPWAEGPRQNRRDLRHPRAPPDAGQARHHYRPRRARPSCLPRLLQARLPEAV
jgi:hypothetical protein